MSSKLPKLPRIAHAAHAASFALGTIVSSITAEAAETVRPNILLVMADDLGWGDVGFNGNATVRTPNLDRLASSGLVFERFYAASPVCSPTRGSCLTGRHPDRYGITHANTGHLPEEEKTLAELCQEAGYVTGHFGKWHLGTLTKSENDSNRGGPRGVAHFSPPRLHGFDESFATEAKVPTYDPMVKPPNAGRTWWHPVTDPEKRLPYGTAYWNHDGSRATENLDGDDSRVLMDRAIAFVERAVRAKEKPFFATVWFHAPHLPVVASDEDVAPYREDHPPYTQHYFGCITALDREVGRLWDRLVELGASGDTLLFFCADNGPEGKAGSAPGSAGRFRGRKRDLYEGGVRVPAFAVWPKRIPKGRRTSFPCVTSDYFPTVQELLGSPPEEAAPRLDGVSIAPLLRGEEGLTVRQAPIVFSFGKKRAVTDDRFKLVSTDGGTRWSLFDFTDDQGESTDVAAQFPEEATRLAREFEEWAQSVRAGRNR